MSLQEQGDIFEVQHIFNLVQYKTRKEANLYILNLTIK